MHVMAVSNATCTQTAQNTDDVFPGTTTTLVRPTSSKILGMSSEHSTHEPQARPVVSPAKQAEDQLHRGRDKVDRHTASKMLGSVTKRASIREIVEHLLDPAAVTSFSAYEDAAFAKENDPDESPKWRRRLRSESKLKNDVQHGDPQAKKRKTDEAQSQSWLEDVRDFVRCVPDFVSRTVSVAVDA